MSQLGGGAGNPVSVGLYRFEGTGKEGNESLAWSVILKVLQSPANVGMVNMGEGENQAHWNYWKRELLVYQSGLLEMLPDGMASPRCFGAVEQPGNTAWLWLEDITDSFAGAWSLARYALTARHLGRLNGMFGTLRPLPTNPWVGANLTQQWGGGIPTLLASPTLGTSSHPGALPQGKFLPTLASRIRAFSNQAQSFTQNNLSW